MDNVLIGFVGDVLVNRRNPIEVFGGVSEILAAPDILFGNLESSYTDNPRSAPGATAVVSAPAHNLDAIADVGFDVMSLANNHIMDAGEVAMLDTRSRLVARGVKTCGAGGYLADAHEPAILELDQVRVAFLAYTSIFPFGHEARIDKPGLASMKAYNYWREPYAAYHAPGMLPLVSTVPDQTDLAQMVEDISRTRERADVVIASFHWGDQTCPYYLTDHETRTARYCIDHGAHMVVGHHHHALRGMEWYKGRPIMYGLGHFAFDFPMMWTETSSKEFSDSEIGRHYRRIGYQVGPRKGWPLLPFPEDGRMTAVAWASANKNGIGDIGFLPCRLDSDGLINPLRVGSKESDEIVSYLKKCNETQGLESSIVSEGARTLAGFQTLRVIPS